MRYNQGWNPTIRMSPYFAVFGKHPSAQFEERISSEQANPEELEDIERVVRKFRNQIKEESLRISKQRAPITVGDLVWWIPDDRLARKLDLFEGPYQVVERVGTTIFHIKELEFGNIHKASLRHLRICS